MKKIINGMKSHKYILIAIIFIFFIAFYLRTMYLSEGALSFGYDQARDAFIVKDMIKGDLKVLGPPVSGIPGLSHGVLYYYVIAPAYMFGHGNPIVVAYFLSFVGSLVIFVVFILSYILTKKIAPSLISALIFAFSFEAIQYSNLLTNASMGVWFVPFIYIGLYLWIKRGLRWAFILTGVALGLSVESEIALFYHIFPIILWLYIFRNKVARKEIFGFILSFIFAVFPMIIAEIKFGFKGVGGLAYLILSKDGTVQSKMLSDFLISVLNKSGTTFAYTIFPNNVVLGSLLGFIMILYLLLIRKSFWSKFLITYIFAYLVALPFGGWDLNHILVGVTPAVSIIIGIFLWENLQAKKYLLAIVISAVLLMNSVKTYSDGRNGQLLFLEKDTLLSKQLEVVDYTYQKSDGAPFSISTLSKPLYVNTLWSYLYNWYGMEKYGRLPYWIGKDQVGQYGNNLQIPQDNVKKHFFIIGSTYGIPDRWIKDANGEQDAISEMVDQREFGEIIVQERERKLVN